MSFLNSFFLSLLLLLPYSIYSSNSSLSEKNTVIVVVNKTDSQLGFIDFKTGQLLQSLKMGYIPHEISPSPDHQRAVVANYGLPEKPSSSLTLVDILQRKVLKEIELKPFLRPHGVDWYESNRIAVAAEKSQAVLIVDPDTGKIVKHFDVAPHAPHMVVAAPDKTKLYTTNIRPGSVTIIDLAMDKVIKTLLIGAGIEGIAISLDGKELWVANRIENKVLVIDTGNLEIKQQFSLEGGPIRITITPDGRYALIPTVMDSHIYLVDVQNKKIVAKQKIDLTPVPQALSRPYAKVAINSAAPAGTVISQDGKTAIIAATLADKLIILDPTTLEIIRYIDSPGEPDGLVLVN